MAGLGKISLGNTTYTVDTVMNDESSLSHFGSHCKVSGESESDAPAVFQCGTCRLPVGDSLSWAGSEEEHNQILLSRTTDNVVVGTEPLFSRTQVELGCVIVNLTCRGCSTLLGQVYTSTPKSLDYKRSLFCFNVESIDCYVLGSSEQTMLLNAQEKPVTLEYREAMELQMEQIKTLAVSMGKRLMEIEAQLEDKEK
ncbi:protein Mis18-alpha [Scleropages formosus]|nr:protein Mis18-alpha [Scleropages formosus]